MPTIRPICLCLLLSGCGGGGGGAGVAATANPQPTRTEAVERLESRIMERPVSDPQRLPTEGRAIYEGYMQANLPTGPNGERSNYIGDLSLNVNFDAARDEIAGMATGFQTGGGDRLDGRLDVAGGDLFRDTNVEDNYTFTGNANGTLRRGDAPYRIDGKIEGEFRGRERDAVSGLLFGDVVGPLGQDIFDGSFAAEKQQQ